MHAGAGEPGGSPQIQPHEVRTTCESTSHRHEQIQRDCVCVHVCVRVCVCVCGRQADTHSLTHPHTPTHSLTLTHTHSLTLTRLADRSFIDQFVALDGLTLLLDILVTMTPHQRQSSQHHQLMKCLQALMNNTYGLKCVLTHPSSLKIIARSLTSRDPFIRLTVSLCDQA